MEPGGLRPPDLLTLVVIIVDASLLAKQLTKDQGRKTNIRAIALVVRPSFPASSLTNAQGRKTNIGAIALAFRPWSFVLGLPRLRRRPRAPGRRCGPRS